MYNTKIIQKENNSDLMQKINMFYSQVNDKLNSLLLNQFTIDNLNVLSNFLLIAFSEFHPEIFFYLLEMHEKIPNQKNNQKVPIAKISCAITYDIIYLLSTQKIDNEIR